MSSSKDFSLSSSVDTEREACGRQHQSVNQIMALQSPSSLRLPLRFPADAFAALHLPAHEILHGRNRAAVCKANGWGFKDTYIYFIDKVTLTITGNRYPLCGHRLQHWQEFTNSIEGLDLEKKSFPKEEIVISPQRLVKKEFLDDLLSKAPGVEVSEEGLERLYHGHGHTCAEIFALRHGQLERLPDVVLFPKCHEDVEAIVACAVLHGVCLIPFGGGTSVTLGLAVPGDEERMVATVSLSYMQRILSLDREALLLTVEAGAVGAVLEEQLRHLGVTLGHEPDSLEFSTVGGWVATRASGMKKNAYGNIEDLLIDAVVVTPQGTLNQRLAAPRVSSGPSVQQLVLGSEGTLGIITQVVLKVKLLPEKKVYGCLVFPSFEIGVAFMRHVALNRLQPASIRLMDKRQTQCGALFRTVPPGGLGVRDAVADGVKRFYLNKVKGWREEDLCACTLLFEGSAEEVTCQQRNLYKAAKVFGALPAGGKNGQRGYQMTFLIAYVRDFVMDHFWVFESFEASLAWPLVLKCRNSVHNYITKECKNKGIRYPPLIMTRLTQVYDAGAVLYFYFGFNWAGIENPMEVYKHIEDGARRVIMNLGGSISHHHGVGKLRREFMASAIGETSMAVLRGVKACVDPQNIFGCKNLLDA
ncbi:FAD linked oxidase family protein, related [Eimeria tenella]|uniref:Alkylglycerone-phosphate synthase n=1 Tax=Eimeria tenella TaxID=5802 RepID=U6KVL5_EIMTE|nr:FAD linked oxidase family protein, related [Eimeria tenella]CDJ42001.1 FAD linked oxidase family protein, related [Eimeria tenella]|eukprot:XP_013232751.1 FAD linked oxidase family protein, related [Eimeria tenella]